MRSRLEYYVPSKARHNSRRDRWRFFLLGLATVYEGLVIVLSLGYLNCEARAYELFERGEDE
jgi:hypothetical protein